MALLYQVDLTAQGNQTVADGGGAYTIDGKTWYAKGDPSQGSNNWTRDLVNGSGLSIIHTSGISNTPIGTSAALNFPHWFLPLSQFTGWSASLALLVRARFSKVNPTNVAALIGFCNSTNDASGLTGTHRVYDRFAGAEPSNIAINSVRYKNSTAGATAATGNAGTILNAECIPGVYMLNARFAAPGSEHLVSGMPTDVASWLATQAAPVANVGATPADNPGIFFGVDAGLSGWSVYLQALRIDVIGELADSSAPVVTLLSPPTTQQIGRTEAIKIRVQDESELKRLYVWAEYDYGTEVIYAGDHFTPRFAALSTLTGSAIDKTFTIRRSGGWLRAPRIHVEPIDPGGNHG